MKLSVVTTLFQSARYIGEFYARASASAQQITDDYEIVLVNDGSPDDSLAIAIELHQRDARVRVVDLSRNFGHHKAMMTGLSHSRGELVFLIDCDLEEAPELLESFHREMLAQSADVVYGAQRKRKGHLVERLGGAIFYSAFEILASCEVPRNLITARLMTRRYVEALVAHKEREVFMAGLWAITGFRQVGLPVEKSSNHYSSYTFCRRLSTLVSGVTSFSNAPLRYVFYLGTVVMLVSGASGVYLIIHAMFFGRFLAGWASLMVSIWLLGGMMIFCMGIVGIYVAKVFSETKQRPYTIVREVYETPPTARVSANEFRLHSEEDRPVLHR